MKYLSIRYLDEGTPPSVTEWFMGVLNFIVIVILLTGMSVYPCQRFVAPATPLTSTALPTGKGRCAPQTPLANKRDKQFSWEGCTCHLTQPAS